MDRQVNPGSGDGILVPGAPLSRYGARADNEGMDAPRGSVELEEAELERLRRRAYGPDADIAGDAAAQARLSELEAAQRRQAPIVDEASGVAAPVSKCVPVPEPVKGPRSASTSVPQPVDVAFAEREPAARSVTEPDSAAGPIADSDPIHGAAAAPWRRRPRWLAILAGAIAALALIAAHIAGMSQLLADESLPIPTTDTATAKMPPVPDAQGRPDSVPTPDYVLALESVGDESDAPNDLHGTLAALGISADELRRYEDFEGLNVWSGESRYGMACVFVAVPVQGLREGYGGEGCSPDGLDAIADLPQMRGDGFTRFMLNGDQINVYVYERARPIDSQG